ncbi:hypothetical protein CMI37_26325 [Candidatus Pacearchaeota archaeon]|nr:hypothetical protein [Candidatus Pacearchaeota archaeon]|tara:strand:+ start:3139 stop:3771 length:633 start_codon:yes stop_codon:yes gene_type:complete
MKKRRLAIGLDETNNGFRIGNKHHPFLIVTGYLGLDGGGYGTPKYGSKQRRKFFGKNPKKTSRILQCAKTYLGEHQDFYYTVIHQKDAHSIDLSKANAVAALTFKFFQEYDINPEQTILFLDEMDGEASSGFINEVLQSWLDIAGLGKTEHRSIRKTIQRSTKRKQVIKTADMIGYYIAALKFLGGRTHWPFRSRKVNLNQLEQMAADIR